MSAISDNWEKLVTSVNKREDWKKSACRQYSRNSSNISSSSSDSYDSENDHSFELPAHQDFARDQGVPFVQTHPRRTLSSSKAKRYIIEERNGKMCYMAGVRQLLILTRRASQFWDWTTRADSRFSKVAVLHYGRCLDIRGRIQTRLLSPDTCYAAYLVFKLTAWSKGLQNVEAVVNFFNEESDRDAQERAHSVYLRHNGAQWGSFAARRVDGWMEVEIGNFYVDGQDKAVEARILEYNSWKAGLIVEGIEFRPLASESPFSSSQGGYHLVKVPQNDSIDSHHIFPPLPGQGKKSDELPYVFPNHPIDEAIMVAQKEDDKDIEFDMSLLQELAAELDSEIKFPPPQSSKTTPLNSDAESKQNRSKKMNTHNELGSYSDVRQTVDHFTESRSGQENRNYSLQVHGVGEEKMAKLLLQQDESLLASLSCDELFSGGHNCLSELVNIFHGMKRMIELKDMEADELKQKLLKSEAEAQLALAAKDSELEELRKKVIILKVEAGKALQYQREEQNKMKEVERKLEDCEARATSAVEDYKNSDELKVDKHKFASKAFSIGFQFCVKQVLEVDPSFNTSRIDVKRLEGSSSIVKI